MRELTTASIFTRTLTDGTVIPLEGKFKVTNHGSTQITSLYSVDGVSIPNPLTVTNGHTSQQAFVGDIDVDVELLDSNDNHVFSYVDLANATISGVTASNLIGVSTIADLRLITAELATNSAVILLGYYAAGDKPALVYNLVHDEGFAPYMDDGGMRISCATSHYYWKAEYNNVCDVRHYGVFPNGVGTLPNIPKIRWFFPYISGLNYQYTISGVTIYNAEFDNNVTIIGDTTSWLIDCNVDAIKVQGNIRVLGDTIKTSIVNDSLPMLQPRHTLIVDNDYQYRPINTSNVEVKFLVSQTHQNTWTFTNCRFLGNAFLGNNNGTWTFNNCKITESMFASGADLTTNKTFNDCTSDRTQWSNGDKWYKCQRYVLNNNVIDLDGMTITQAISDYGDIKLRNAIVNANFTTSQGYLEANNCKFSANVIAEYIVATDCVFDNRITLHSNSTIKDCEVNGIDVDADGLHRMVNINIIRNQFNANGHLYFNGGATEEEATYVNKMVVTNNVFTSANIFKRYTFASEQGKYVFDDNTGLTVFGSNKLQSLDYINGTRSVGNSNHKECNWYVNGSGSGSRLILHQQYPALRDVLFNFGERYNSCDIGCNGAMCITSIRWIPTEGGTTERFYNDGSTYDMRWATFENGSQFNHTPSSWEEPVSFKGTEVGHQNQIDLYKGFCNDHETTRSSSIDAISSLTINQRVRPITITN